VTRLSSTSAELSREAILAEGNSHRMNEDPLALMENGPDMDLEMVGDLQPADSAVEGYQDPSVTTREKVSEMNESRRTPTETRLSALVRFR
jgi:hypothetical protein